MAGARMRISATGLDAFINADKAVYEAVKSSMDDIRDDVKAVSQSLTPEDTGKLAGSAFTRRTYKSLDSCSFSISYRATNNGFDYAKWTHDADYKLGEGSMRKRPIQGKFARGTLKVGPGYLSQVEEASSDAWTDYIAKNIDSSLKRSVSK
jgi:hypothetical protein